MGEFKKGTLVQLIYSSLIISVFIFFILAWIPSVYSIDISACGLINESGSYDLLNNISKLSNNCINITASNVTFDCHGFNITGSGNYNGIYIINSNNVTISNCQIRNFNIGIYSKSVQNSFFDNINSSFSGAGINAMSGVNNTFSNINLFNNSMYGLLLSSEENDNVYNSSMKENGLSDFYVSANNKSKCDHLVSNLIGSGDLPIGFYNTSAILSTQNFSQLILCDADNSVLNNIILSGSSYIDNNQMVLVYTDNASLYNINSINNNVGIYLKNSNNNLIDMGVFVSNLYGVEVVDSINTTLGNITCFNNSVGVFIDESQNVTLLNSNLTDNTNYDLDFGLENPSEINNAYLCSHRIENVWGSGNLPIGYFNDNSDVGNKTFSELFICNAYNSDFYNITVDRSSGLNINNNWVYFKNISYSNFYDINIIGINGFEIHQVNNSVFNDITSEKNPNDGIWVAYSYNNSFVNITVIDNSRDGLSLQYSGNNIINSSMLINNSRYGILVSGDGAMDNYSNKIYNNYFNNSANVLSVFKNYWNTSQKAGANIIGGSFIGGNFWSNPSGTGHSQTCTNLGLGICQESYSIAANNVDDLGLTYNSASIIANITSCVDINDSGTYYVENNITSVAAVPCINIKADDVTLNCQNHVLDGDFTGVSGIRIIGYNNINIINCTFMQYTDYGLQINNVNDSEFENLDTILNGIGGVSIITSNNNTFTNCDTSDNGEEGFDLSESTYNQFIGVTSNQNGYDGFFMFDADFNTIKNSNIQNNDVAFDGGVGIYFEDSDNNLIFNNLFNNTENMLFISNNNLNEFNSTILAQSSVINSPYIGGNYWAKPDGSGFSEGCVDAVLPFGICDNLFNQSELGSASIDNYPLTQFVISYGISSCDDVNFSGNYTITVDLTSTTASPCLRIFADNVEINCDGHTIDGNFTGITGFRAIGRSNVTLRNCTFMQYTDYGLQINNVNNSVFENVNSVYNDIGGISIVSSHNNQFLQFNTSENAEEGFDLSESTNNEFVSVTSNQNGYDGFFMFDVDYNTIKDSYIQNNDVEVDGGVGIYFEESDNNLIYNNLFNNTENMLFISTNSFNDFNTALSLQSSIVQTAYLGGNYWAKPDGSGFSEGCADVTAPYGVCDNSFNQSEPDSISIDNLPLSDLIVSFDISACRDLNYAGNYTVSVDLTSTNGNPCIRILANDIVIDCEGHTLDGDFTGVAGVRAIGYSNLTLKNCTLMQFTDYGLQINNVNDSLFENVSSVFNDIGGVSMVDGNNNIFRYFNTSDNAEEGFDLSGSDYNQFINVVSDLNGYDGFYIYDSFYNTIKNSLIRNNDVAVDGGVGIFFEDSGSNYIYNNLFNNTANFDISSVGFNNYFNTSLSIATSIIDTGYISGNFWANPGSTGFSQTCDDYNIPYTICDEAYNFSFAGHQLVDYAPLTEYVNPVIINLLTPVNNSLLGNARVIFNCSVDMKNNLQNISLFGNWTGSWEMNDSAQLTGHYNYSTFTKIILGNSFIWNCYACDTLGNCSFADGNSKFTINNDKKPVISSLNKTPAEKTAQLQIVTDIYSNVTVNYGYGGSLNRVKTDSSFNIEHGITLISLSSNKTVYFNVTVCSTTGNCSIYGIYNLTTNPIVLLINYTDWKNETTNFTKLNETELENIPNVTFSKENGKIKFIDPINISRSINFTGKVIISQNNIFINSSAVPELNKKAKLFLHNLTFINPRVLKDAVYCPSPGCVILNYSNGTLEFNVTSFSTYTAEETPYCGDSSCNNGETCSSCATDCGSCSSGGGGGGGSGGSPSSGCTEKWTCGNWSTCTLFGYKLRDCVDERNCSTEKLKPPVQQSCSYFSSLLFDDLDSDNSVEDNTNNPDQNDASIDGSNSNIDPLSKQNKNISQEKLNELDSPFDFSEDESSYTMSKIVSIVIIVMFVIIIIAIVLFFYFHRHDRYNM